MNYSPFSPHFQILSQIPERTTPDICSQIRFRATQLEPRSNSETHNGLAMFRYCAELGDFTMLITIPEIPNHWRSSVAAQQLIASSQEDILDAYEM
jgi:hypothetical protein